MPVFAMALTGPDERETDRGRQRSLPVFAGSGLGESFSKPSSQDTRQWDDWVLV